MNNQKNQSIKVSIAIPFHNDAKYLSFSIQSVINQSYKDWELILLDDGSTDSSLQIAKEFERENIRVISDGKNKGLAIRLNELSLLASGKYYARMDADDVMDFERIEKQVNYLERHPEVDVVGSDVYVIDKDNNIIGKTNTRIASPKTVEDIFSGGQFVHPSIMGKRQWFIENPYDEKLVRMQDKGLWLRTVEKSHFEILPDKYLFYRAGGLPTTKKNLKELSCLKTLYFKILWKEQKRNMMALKLYFVSLIKLLVYGVFEAFGQYDYLVRRRYASLDKVDIIKGVERFKVSIKQ